MNLAMSSALWRMVRFVFDCNARALVVTSVAAAAFALPVVASADTWVGIDRDVGKSVLYLDRHDIAHVGSTEKAWLLYDFDEPRNTANGREQYRSMKEQVAVRCADRTYARVKQIEYSNAHASGEVIGTYAWAPGMWRFEKPVPFTNSQAVVDSVCPVVAARLPR